MHTNSIRYNFLDIAKGIGILFVVIGHTGIPLLLSKWIWSFHMPLFFFISGILFDKSRYPNLLLLLKRRIRTLIIPYLFFTIFVFSLAVIIKSSLIDTSYSQLYLGWDSIALWFLPILFLTEIFFYITIHFLRYRKYLFRVILVFSFIGYILYKLKIHYPFKFEVVFIALFFYGIGYLYGNSIILYFKTKSFRIKLFYLILLFSITLFVSIILDIRLDLAFNVLGNYLISIPLALLGVIYIIFFSTFIYDYNIKVLNNILLYLGRNTLVILSLHQIITVGLISIFDNFELNKYFSSFTRQSLLWILLLLCIYIFNKYLPLLIGRKNTLK